MKNLRSIQKVVGVLFGIFVLTNCNQVDPAAQKMLKEANDIHNEAVKVENAVKEKMADLESIQANLAAKAEAAADSEAAEPIQAVIAELSGIQSAYGLWSESVVEVPGQEHNHDHGHDHDHDHAHDHSLDDMSPADMLTYQKELKSGIEEIATNLTGALEKASAILAPAETEE